jgi:hypothetical protein
MSETRTIEIDFELHKKIETERTSFSETPNDVLRRLLNLGGRQSTPASSQPSGRPWSGKGATLPHSTELRMEYNGRQYTGSIDDGEWFVEGQRFRSPSAAAGGVAITKDGTHPSLDGWVYWQVKRPGDGTWTPLKKLRR